MYNNNSNRMVKHALDQIHQNHILNEAKAGLQENPYLNGNYEEGIDSKVEKLYKKQVPVIGGRKMEMVRSKRQYQKQPLFGMLKQDLDNIDMRTAKLAPIQPMRETSIDNISSDNDELIGEGWVDGALKLGSKAVALGTKMAPKIKKALPYIKKGLTLTKEITGAIDNEKSQKVSSVLGSLGFGEELPKSKATGRRTARAEAVKKVMREKNLSMIQASKYIKENNISY